MLRAARWAGCFQASPGSPPARGRFIWRRTARRPSRRGFFGLTAGAFAAGLARPGRGAGFDEPGIKLTFPATGFRDERLRFMQQIGVRWITAGGPNAPARERTDARATHEIGRAHSPRHDPPGPSASRSRTRSIQRLLRTMSRSKRLSRPPRQVPPPSRRRDPPRPERCQTLRSYRISRVRRWRPPAMRLPSSHSKSPPLERSRVEWCLDARSPARCSREKIEPFDCNSHSGGRKADETLFAPQCAAGASRVAAQ